MKHQAFRPAALMLSFLLVAAVPAKAGTVHFADAVHVLPHGRTGTASDVRLRVAPQSGGAATVAQQTGQRGGGPASSPQQTGSNTPGAPAGPGGATSTTTAPADTTLSQSGGQVETVDLGDVTGTVCDCGEIPVIETPGGGFPLWPLLGLLGVPLAFIPGDGDRIPPGFNPTPNPTPGPNPIPEPATLLLFGTSLLALGAGARRRLSRRREGEGEVEVAAAEEVI